MVEKRGGTAIMYTVRLSAKESRGSGKYSSASDVLSERRPLLLMRTLGIWPVVVDFLRSANAQSHRKSWRKRRNAVKSSNKSK